ncbi:hypothetical protein F4818DRAFT_207866 [Hypoxylon cercidicola]|nr:hypothetical protein F4818DRAFT_207866 [Hypoxylon cercidicola]
MAAGLLGMWSLLVLVLSFFAPYTEAQDLTTVPIFLPAYEATKWSQLRGSIISSNDVETLYTIFCAPSSRTATGEDLAGCAIDSRLPFTFFEGPSTLHLGQTVESEFTVTQACDLAGTTAATCSFSTSLASSFSLGPLHGPVDTAQAPLALTGAAVQWGVLTLAQPPLTSTVDGSRVVTYYPPPSSSETAAVSTPTATSGKMSAVETGSGSGSGSETVAAETAASTSGSSSSSSGSETGAAAETSASTPPSSAAKLGGWENRLEASLLLGAVVSALLW